MADPQEAIVIFNHLASVTQFVRQMVQDIVNYNNQIIILILHEKYSFASKTIDIIMTLLLLLFKKIGNARPGEGD